jgi:hypothetical protein
MTRDFCSAAVVRIDFTLADWSAGVPPSGPESWSTPHSYVTHHTPSAPEFWSTPHSYASHTISTIDSLVI